MILKFNANRIVTVCFSIFLSLFAIIGKLTIDPAKKMTDFVPAIFKRHIGSWQGEYIKTNAQGHFIRSFKGTFTIHIEGTIYRQVNYYEYADGSDLTLQFEGQFEAKILKLNSSNYEEFFAFAWDAGHDTIGFKVNKKQDNSLITYMETIYLINDHYRVRTTQEFKDQQFIGVNLIEEVKKS